MDGRQDTAESFALQRQSTRIVRRHRVSVEMWGLPWGSCVLTNSDTGTRSEYIAVYHEDARSVGNDRSSRAIGGVAKRAFDMIVAALFLLTFSPLLLLVAAAVRLGSPGPVLFGHTRVGHDGRPFRCWKFRSMVTDGDAVLEAHFASNPGARAEWEATRKLKDDPRVTPLGRVMRAYSVDELPQFFNVLLGDMSLVGPRPVVVEELERYGPAAAAYLAARPGLTGLWQISGRSDTSYGQRVALDSRYAAEWSLALDARILLRTVPVVLAARGAC